MSRARAPGAKERKPRSRLPEKTCAVCGRTITWRKAWSRTWDQVRYCSDACRARRSQASDGTLEARILALLQARARDASICPSDVARSVAEDWRPLMEPVREAARRLVARGVLEITQGGRPVDPSHARGAIRLRLRR
ncbi:MAG TPA: DUF2256 and DUF3253 domain-containing protein [Myxococcaceae bacterium]|nr:DUF2256 and DUF3253 domain-containing protein [Myxococcaceae bacterium]